MLGRRKAIAPWILIQKKTGRTEATRRYSSVLVPWCVMAEETSTSTMPAFEASEEMQRFLANTLVDKTLPISERYRALFTLRNLRGRLPLQALISAMDDPSNLLAHEAAFALGQMQDPEAVPFLKSVLLDKSRHPIVRHEAAEALGAISLEDYIPLLQNILVMDPAQEVRETCELALRRIEESKYKSLNNDISSVEVSPFLSVDPASAASSKATVQELREMLLDGNQGMYERYAALFALRNHGGGDAVDAIIAALKAESALLRHEVAYVLGQLQDNSASAALLDVLSNVNEHPMVRHEAAEALGSIADSNCVALLKQYAEDDEPIVSQSCEVALRMVEFEKANKSFIFLQQPEVQ